MNIENVHLDPDHCSNVSELKKILEEIPISISGPQNLQLRAYVGLGDVVYIEPTSEHIDYVRFLDKNIDMESDSRKGTVFNYKDRKFSVLYKKYYFL